MTIQLAYKQLLSTLYPLYTEREAANIANWVIEHLTGQNKINRILNKDLPVSLQQQQRMQEIQLQLLTHKPVQYILNEVWFAGLKMYVNEHVLIPRPETEELVDWITSDLKKVEQDALSDVALLDVGTGSGSIAITLKKQLTTVAISALDVSFHALEVARKNAADQQTTINFLQADFLEASTWDQLSKYDVIVSNPPYIKEQEAHDMSKNVLDFEPLIALFVPDDDALIFYRAVAVFAQTHLKENGSIYVEINEALGREVIALFIQHGFVQTTLRQDLQGKDRMIKASR